MRADILIQTQRLIAEAIFAIAEHIANSTGYQLTAITHAELPATPMTGMLACITDSNVNMPGDIVGGGGGTHTVLLMYDGTDWKVK